MHRKKLSFYKYEDKFITNLNKICFINFTLKMDIPKSKLSIFFISKSFFLVYINLFLKTKIT